MEIRTAELERKVLHVVLCLILAFPYMIPNFPRAEVFSALALSAALINAVMLKKPLLTQEIRVKLREKRRRALEALKSISPPMMTKNIDSIDSLLTRLEETFEEQISRMERSYERVGGYIGVTHGILGVLIAEVLFKEKAFYGVLALLIIDTVSAVISVVTGFKRRLPFSSTTVDGLIASSATFFVVSVVLLGVEATKAGLAALFLAMVEAYAPEDNLLLPPAGGFLALVLDMF